MKNLIPGLFLFIFVMAGHSQIVLDEARISSEATSMKVDPISGMYVFEIPEKHFGEFEKDPLKFVKTRFDIKKFLADNEDEKFVLIEVVFKTKKGKLVAEYDGDGNLLASNMKLKNVLLPDDAKLQILQHYRNADITGATHEVVSKGWNVKKDVYRVKFHDGLKNRKVKISKNGAGMAIAGL